MNKELKELLIKAARNESYDTFSAEDIQKAAQVALAEEFEGRSLRHLNPSDFAIIEEVITEITPLAVEDVIGRFAEVRTFGRNEQVLFTIKGIGGARVMRAIVPSAIGGIYESRRLDNKHMELDTHVEGVAYKLGFEDLITGRVTVADYAALVVQGFVEVVYQKMIGALRAAAAAAPAANRSESAGAAVELKALDDVIRVIAAYGTPTIFGFESALGELGNVATDSLKSYAPSRSTQDLNDIRDFGRVMKYRGRDVVSLPNFLTDNSNSKWVFDESEMFVLPANEKPIKVAFQGEAFIIPNNAPQGGIEFNTHRIMGVGVLFNNAIGSYKIKDWKYTGEL